jgi:primosomal protein N' (replication factor Y)
VSLFADVILPLPFDRYFTYSVAPADEKRVRRGSRVVVPFGRSKSYTAIVAALHAEKPKSDFTIKEVTAVLDDHPILVPQQMKFWQWIADYYLCTIGEVYNAAIPSGMKVESETLVEMNESYHSNESLSDKEQALLGILGSMKNASIQELQKKSGEHNLLPIVKSLIDRGAIIVSEELRGNYHPRTEARIRFKDPVGQSRLDKLFTIFKGSPKREALLMKYVELSGCLRQHDAEPVSKSRLLTEAEASPASLKGLIDKNIFEIYYEDIGRLDTVEQATTDIHPLNEYQQKALKEVEAAFEEKNVCLLHGVTSSGKTEVYIHLISEAIKAGKQVLYLLPEIALTTQITHRLKQVFGTRLGIYHSKFPDAERVEVWNKQLSDKPYDIILGVRSSVFLPFRKLGLVIVDEEHETTYKQQDPAPRYHARNAAIVLASLYGAKTLLGSATPSIESRYNAQTGKYGYVPLTHRYLDIKLPQIVPVDMKKMRKRKEVNGIFSFELIKQIRGALERHEQVILFQNRRGFSPIIMCHTCGWIPRCAHCDVSLTYHKRLNRLTCHYCGYSIEVPQHCPACESTELLDRGFGTEKIESNVQDIFPEARVARMDLDTTRNRSSYERILSDFERGDVDILIGTQIISKGLDFDRVSVVGILDADLMLNYPDFRSYERAFQLMEQVAGRAGRKDKQGLVIVQTRDVKQPIIDHVIHHDYELMTNEQLEERQLFNYPPYCHLIYAYIKHRDERQAQLLSTAFAIALRKVFGDRVIGPDLPPVGKIQSLFIRKIVVKIENNASLAEARQRLRAIRQNLIADPYFKSCIIYYDVDPM